METYHKNRLLFWVLIFLIIVNLAALGTYLFFPGRQTIVSCEEAGMNPGCLYKTRLDLSESQSREVDRLSEEYTAVSGPIADEIKSIRGMILDELSGDDPDTTILNRHSVELAELQAQLQKENIKHYMALKEVITPEQALRLSNLYRELYGCPMQGAGRKFQHRHKE
jgi:hypothetical protein